jgi:hypothetical protein
MNNKKDEESQLEPPKGSQTNSPGIESETPNKNGGYEENNKLGKKCWDWVLKNVIKAFFDWFLMAEKEYGEKFEKKYNKGLNFTRIVGLILMIWNIPLLCQLLTEMVKPIFFKAVITFILLYILIILYKAWIKKLWYFLQKDSIIHYIFLALIPAVIIFYGYQYIVGKSSIQDNLAKNKQIVQTDITLKNDYDEIIDRLNGFYASLFTAIAVIAAIIALGAWKTVKELREKLEKFKKIEDDVEFLRKKKDLAEWVQDKFEKDVDKKILSSITFDLTREEEKNLKEIKEQILRETTDDSWLKLVYAKELLKEKQKNKITEEDEFIKIENIFNFIENIDLLKEDSEIPELLYHMKALMYWIWYDNKKSDFIRKNGYPEKKLPWVENWWKEYESESKDENKDKSKVENKYKRIELLKKSVVYYEKAIKIYSKKKGINPDETLGNLSVVLIELSKFKNNDEKTKKREYLDQALDHLKKIKKETFNTHWDKARVLYYLDSKKFKTQIVKLLDKAERESVEDKDKKFFKNGIENERKEIYLDGPSGFPGEIWPEEKEKGFFKSVKNFFNRKNQKDGNK